jgi:hypothetical protein
MRTANISTRPNIGNRVSGRKKAITFFFVFCVLYQYLVHVGLSILDKKDSLKPIFDFTSPYTIFVALAIVYSLITILRGGKLIILLAMALLVLYVIALINHLSDPNVMGNPVKSIQYFYGILIVFIGGVALLEFSRVEAKSLAQTLITVILAIASVVTIYEFIVSNLIVDPKGSFFYKYLEIGNEYNSGPGIRIRPFGLALYPQPNGNLIVCLTTLYLLWCGRLGAVGYLGAAAALLSMGGTAVASLTLVLLARSGRAMWSAAIGLVSISLTLLVAIELLPTIASKLNYEYVVLLLNFAGAAFSKFTSAITLGEVLWGVNETGLSYAPGVTHDWTYFDVAYEFGLFGLACYLLIYIRLILFTLPRDVSRIIKLSVATLFLAINFHYPTLNFYSGQMSFGILAAIGYYSRKSSQRIAGYPGLGRR